GPANPLVQWDTRMRRYRTLKRPEHQHRRVGNGRLFQHVKSDPVVSRYAIVQKLDYLPHEVFDGPGSARQSIEFTQDFLVSGRIQHTMILIQRDGSSGWLRAAPT